MISAKAYETMRKKYGGVSGWGIWGGQKAIELNLVLEI